MAYCYRCGVKLEADALACPLCGTPVPEDSSVPEGSSAPSRGHAGGSSTSGATSVPNGTSVPGGTSVPNGGHASRPNSWPTDNPGEPANDGRAAGYRCALARQILLVVFMTPVLVLLAIRVIVPDTAGWIDYILVSLVAVWAMGTIPLAAYRRPVLIPVGELGVIAVLLMTLDLLGGQLSWSLVIGVPVVVLAGVLAAIVTLLIARMRERSANAAAVIICALGLLVLGLDLIIGSYVTGNARPTWSLVVIAGLSPVAAFLGYYHRFLRRRMPLGRRFHV